uniref:Uncharacterized protein n=1 Tax=Knipowitschia caucasica TaxID=637954 RepID=A0AAV2M797_KNICA
MNVGVKGMGEERSGGGGGGFLCGCRGGRIGELGLGVRGGGGEMWGGGGGCRGMGVGYVIEGGFVNRGGLVVVG